MEDEIKKQRVASCAPELYDKLRKSYRRRPHAISVDFRAIAEWVRQGDQLTHQIHPYPAKLLPHIANFFVHAFKDSRKSNRVLDPFCGTGTVALEASLSGAVPYIADANPLAILIARVKTTPYNCKTLEDALRHLLSRARRFKNAPYIQVVNESLWYSPPRKHELEILFRAVSEVPNGSVQDFFSVCASVTARRLSKADPAISVPVKLRTKSKFSDAAKLRISRRLRWIQRTHALDEFERIASANIARVMRANAAREDRSPAVYVGSDARNLRAPETNGDSDRRLAANTVQLVLTSPPYGSAQKYVRASSLSLNWLGLAAPEELAKLESASIGREHVPMHRESDTNPALPKTYERLVKRISSIDATRARIVRHYLTDMRLAAQEMGRVVSKGGRVVVVIGNNTVCDHPLRNDVYIESVLSDSGLVLDLKLRDTIRSRGLMTKRNRTASMITQESVLVFRKAIG